MEEGRKAEMRGKDRECRSGNENATIRCYFQNLELATGEKIDGLLKLSKFESSATIWDSTGNRIGVRATWGREGKETRDRRETNTGRWS